MKPNQKTLVAGAYHEAGHAVVATLLGDTIVDVRLNIDARTVGEIEGRVTRHNPAFAHAERLLAANMPVVRRTDDANPDMTELMQAWGTNLIVAFAGPEAQRRHDPKSMRSYRLRDDENDITQLLRQVSLQSTREIYRHRAKRSAAVIVRKCWPAIEKVAAALVERGVLTGEEIKQIIDENVRVKVERP